MVARITWRLRPAPRAVRTPARSLVRRQCRLTSPPGRICGSIATRSMSKSQVEPLSLASSSVLQDEVQETHTRPGSLPGWVREPLVHFVLIGFVLFGVDHFVARRADDSHTIVV